MGLHIVGLDVVTWDKFKFPQGLEQKWTEHRVNEVCSGKMKFNEAEWYQNLAEQRGKQDISAEKMKVRKSNS